MYKRKPRRFRKPFKDNKDNKPTGLSFEKKDFDYGTPQKEKVGDGSYYFQKKAFRDLQNVGLIEVKADPNTQASKAGVPYNIIAQTNKVVDANYAGYENISGNTITLLQNSTDSQLLNSFDSGSINIRMNYLNMCYKTNDTTKHNNLAVNREFLKAFTEALSKGYSTMLTQLPYYTNIITTDMPEIPGLTDAQKDIYGKFGGIIHYQTVQQTLVSPLAKYIQTMSLENEIMMMSYRREAPTITSLFGLFRKKAFIANLNSIGTNVIGEYFDLNWYKQNNTLINVPSRKSKALTDPLLTATATTFVPKCVMKTGPSADPYYDSDQTLKITGKFIDPDTFAIEQTTLKLEEVVYRLNRMLDQNTILTWARKLNVTPSAVGNITTPSAYYTQITNLIEYINTMATSFVTNVADIRTFIDKLQDSGMVYWRKGITISVENIQSVEVNYNVLLHDLIAAYIGGSETMSFDLNTQRWQCRSLWNKYEGIAEFDKKSGGSFLTFGLRKLEVGDISSTDIQMCLPIFLAPALTTGSNKLLVTTRLGARHEVTSLVQTLLEDPVLARLDPLKNGFSVKIPYMDLSSYTTPAARAKMSSAALQLLQNLAGFGYIKLTTTTHVSVCDPDYISFVDVQIEDVSNEMITYCRNYSPFRIQTPDGKRTIGFGSK